MTSSRQYVRVLPEQSNDPESLETATVRFVPSAPGAEESYVDVIGCVHIGDRAYYDALNQQLKSYDAVLFELVISKEDLAKFPNKDPESGVSAIRMFQSLMSSTLGLEHQTELIDYTPANMVHADMSPADLKEAMKKITSGQADMLPAPLREILKKAGIDTSMLEMLQQAMQSAQKMQSAGQVPGFSMDDVMKVVMAYVSGQNPSRHLKMFLAKTMRANTALLEGTGHPITGVLIGDRNEVALKVLGRELANGKRKIGIFYGAGHGPDFETRLTRDFGLVPTTETWLTAWNMKP